MLTTGQFGLFWRTATGAWNRGEAFGRNIPDTPPVSHDPGLLNTANENAHGGIQFLITNQAGYVENWQRLNDNVVDHPPVANKQGKWEQVGGFGHGQIMQIWGLMQGTYNFTLEAIVEDYYGELWHWQYTGKWKRMKKLPSAYKTTQPQRRGSPYSARPIGNLRSHHRGD
jgi:hypothetical protein